jgi:hypothetical protein
MKDYKTLSLKEEQELKRIIGSLRAFTNRRCFNNAREAVEAFTREYEGKYNPDVFERNTVRLFREAYKSVKKKML